MQHLHMYKFYLLRGQAVILKPLGHCVKSSVHDSKLWPTGLCTRFHLGRRSVQQNNVSADLSSSDELVE